MILSIYICVVPKFGSITILVRELTMDTTCSLASLSYMMIYFGIRQILGLYRFSPGSF
jgi:hypothetical protein